MDVVGSNSLIKAYFAFGYEVFISDFGLVMITFFFTFASNSFSLILSDVQWLQAKIIILVRIFKRFFFDKNTYFQENKMFISSGKKSVQENSANFWRKCFAKTCFKRVDSLERLVIEIPAELQFYSI